MYNLVTYCSYRLKGFAGAVLATFLFILPSYLLILSLSWIYFKYGSVSWVHPLFIALEAMVVGVISHVFLDFANRYASDRRGALLASTAFILLVFKIHALYVILIASILSIILFHDQKDVKRQVAKEKGFVPGKFSQRVASEVVVSLGFVVILLFGLLNNSLYSKLMFSMFKVGAVAFGNAFTIMPLLQQEVVFTHHWLTMKEFADGIAFGQITPGPFLITATFIGYKVAGIWGSILATLGMFYPSFFYTIVFTEIYGRIKDNQWIQIAIKGIMGAFTGMIFFVTLSLAKTSLVSSATYIWAVAPFLLVRYYKISLLKIFIIGITFAWIAYLAGNLI